MRLYVLIGTARVDRCSDHTLQVTFSFRWYQMESPIMTVPAMTIEPLKTTGPIHPTFDNNIPIMGVPPRAPNPQIKKPTPILDPISFLFLGNDIRAGAVMVLNTPDETP